MSSQDPTAFLHRPTPTPVTRDTLVEYLRGYPQTLINELHSGFRYGFRLGFSGNDVQSVPCANLK